MNRLLSLIVPLMGRGRLVKYSLVGILSGICSFLFINFITRIIRLIMAGQLNTISREYLLVIASIILVFMWIRRTLSLAIIHLSQSLFWRLRRQVLALVLSANYLQLAERKSRIQATMFGDVSTLTDASLNIIQFFSASILAFVCCIYLLSISGRLFLITFLMAAIGVTVYRVGTVRNRSKFVRARMLENSFMESFNSMLQGFREIYIEPRKGKYVLENKISPVAREAFRNSVSAYTGYLNNQITSQVLYYVLISSVLLIFSVYLKIKPADTVSYLFTLLYLLSSIETIMILLPALTRSRIAAEHLLTLQDELKEENITIVIPSRYVKKEDFQRMTVSQLEFAYDKNEEGFSIGPVSLDIRKGEVVFIYGGNGSGKTTLVYAILGICFPTAGQVRLNDVLVDKDSYADYRTLFAVVFNDFYLFKEVIGVETVDMDKWSYYLRLFELEGKVTLEGRTLSTTNLSAGQRKRLALITALLEDKPVLILDEWAADQDPYFRKKFYREIIPLLKTEGFTILAITHDDKYYDCADKLFRMDYGKLIAEHAECLEPSTLEQL
jgi:cyclic peptide transporter